MGSSSHHSIWHPVLAEISKAVGASVAGKLPDYAISRILQVLTANQNRELKLLQSISQDVKDMKEGPYDAGLTWLKEAGKVGIPREERTRRIELAQEKFIDALSQEKRDKFRLALIQYHIGICAFLLGQTQGQGTEFWYADAGDWLEKAYNSVMGIMEEAIRKYMTRNKVENAIVVSTTVGTLFLSTPLTIIYLNVIRGPRPEKKFFKQIEPMYLFLSDIEQFKAETPAVPLNLQRQLVDLLQRIEYIKKQNPWGGDAATKGTAFSDKRDLLKLDE